VNRARNKRIFEMWMACYSTDEIAEALDCAKGTVSNVCSEMADLPKMNKAAAARSAAEHAIDFDPPIYNIWKQQEKTAGSSHFGNSEVSLKR
jgi:hypothetical protein